MKLNQKLFAFQILTEEYSQLMFLGPGLIQASEVDLGPLISDRCYRTIALFYAIYIYMLSDRPISRQTSTLLSK